MGCVNRPQMIGLWHWPYHATKKSMSSWFSILSAAVIKKKHIHFYRISCSWDVLGNSTSNISKPSFSWHFHRNFPLKTLHCGVPPNGPDFGTPPTSLPHCGEAHGRWPCRRSPTEPPRTAPRSTTFATAPGPGAFNEGGRPKGLGFYSSLCSLYVYSKLSVYIYYIYIH